MTLTLLPAFFPVRVLLKYCTTSCSIRPESIESSCLAGLNEENEIVSAFLLAAKDTNGAAKPSVDFVTLSNTRKTA